MDYFWKDVDRESDMKGILFRDTSTMEMMWRRRSILERVNMAYQACIIQEKALRKEGRKRGKRKRQLFSGAKLRKHRQRAGVRLTLQ